MSAEIIRFSIAIRGLRDKREWARERFLQKSHSNDRAGIAENFVESLWFRWKKDREGVLPTVNNYKGSDKISHKYPYSPRERRHIHLTSRDTPTKISAQLLATFIFNRAGGSRLRRQRIPRVPHLSSANGHELIMNRIVRRGRVKRVKRAGVGFPVYLHGFPVTRRLRVALYSCANMTKWREMICPAARSEGDWSGENDSEVREVI